jgi:hypothetical protein
MVGAPYREHTRIGRGDAVRNQGVNRAGMRGEVLAFRVAASCPRMGPFGRVPTRIRIDTEFQRRQ